MGIQFSRERYDVFSDAPSASSAAEFGTQGVNVLAWKPAPAGSEGEQRTL